MSSIANGTKFSAAVPSPPLRAFVECIWMVRGAAPYRRAQVLPNGALQLMFNFGEPHQVVGLAGREVRQRHGSVWIAGLQDRPLGITTPARSDLLAIRFRPGGAAPFLGLPLQALTNEVVDAASLPGSAAAALHEQLALAPHRRAQVQAVESWLLARLARQPAEHGLVMRAVAALTGPRSPASVQETCERLGLSNRHLIELFRRHVGLAPKSLARVTRFHASLRGLVQGTPRAELAHGLGYADQAHFNHEFRRYSGVAPGAFIERRGDDGESLIG